MKIWKNKSLIIIKLLVAIILLSSCDARPVASTVQQETYTLSGEQSTPQSTPTNKNTLNNSEGVKLYDDVRGKNLSEYNLSKALIESLTFDQTTLWSESDQIIAQNTLGLGKKLTFGLDNLHSQGITGKGVNVAIIDLNLDVNHPEFKDKVVKYVDLIENKNIAVSVHGSAVTSILAGNNLGTAPEVSIYYVAVPAWTLDARYYAEALDWIIDENNQLPQGEKIRVVSVSAIPSGIWSQYTNQEEWEAAYQRAIDAGILVLDCTFEHGYTVACTYDLNDPNNNSKCIPNWIPGPTSPHKRINIPTSRTVAVESQGNKEIEYGYLFTGIGGLSWTTSYLAGILAMGWQINPNLTDSEILNILFESSELTSDGQSVVAPQRFIDMIKLTTMPKN